MSEVGDRAQADSGNRVLADRCSRLIRFLRDLAQSQTSRVVDVETYPVRLWLSDLPGSITPDVAAGGGDVLLTVPPVAVIRAPDLPDVLTGWVSLTDRDNSSLDQPDLRPQGPRTVVEDLPGGERRSSVVTVSVEEALDVRRAYQDWLPSWQAWAARDRLTARQREAFDALYTVYERLSQEGDELELLLGTGLLTYLTPEGVRVRHPLLTTRVEAAVDGETNAMVLRFPDEAMTRLEDGALLQGSREFHAERTNAIHEHLRASDPVPLGADHEHVLRDWLARGLGAAEGYDGDRRPQTEVTSRPQIRFAPVLLLRPRGRSALLNYYDAMLAALAKDQRPPLGLAQLVETLEPEERMAWLEEEGATSGRDLGADPLFPLPANPEQAQIVDRLGADNGVVVEGPPGTGKTHTIANLISALLAQGQRVLITSQKAQALRVLRDKLPPDMQRLCVSLTDVSRGGSPELAGSIAALAAEKASHSPALRADKIMWARDKRAQALAKRSKLTEQVRALRESETYQHPDVAVGYSGSLAAIAAVLKANQRNFEWMPKPVTAPLSVTSAEAHELLSLLRSETPERAARPHQDLPALDEFPTAPDMTAQMQAEAEAGRVAQVGASPLSAALSLLGAEQVAELEVTFHAFDQAAGHLQTAVASGDADWVRRAIADGFARRDESLWELLIRAAPEAAQAQAALRWIGLHQVTLPSAGEYPYEGLLAATRSLREFLSAGGQLKKMFKPDQQRAAEPVLEYARVDGAIVQSVEQLDLVAAALEAEALTAAVARQWFHVGIDVAVDLPLPVRVARVCDLYRRLELVGQLLAAKDQLAALLERNRVREAPLRDVAECAAFGDALQRVRLRLKAEAATAALDRFTDQLERQGRATAAPPELAELADAIRGRNPGWYGDRLRALASAHAEQAAQRRCEDLIKRLGDAHPPLAALLSATCIDPAWDERLRRLPEAWAWAEARTFFDHQREPGREQRLEGELAVAEQSVAQATASLATELAWQQALERMDAHQVAALQSYRAAIDARGKGTGKFAKHYSRAARDAMRDAQGAVPAWIMPLPEVLSTIPPIRDSFDVVIVDEASQASLESLFLLWLAPRVIVVGDDRQCTPPEIAMGALEPIFSRLNDLLPDLPSYLRVAFTPRSSLFSILRARFGQVIRLREHFRCMPEIIEWSSNMFYRDQPLIPLRQFGADRLEPLKTHYVPAAYNEGRHAAIRNEPEAEALVERVLACAADPAYDGKTFGVVVLQGSGQVDVIRNAIVRRIPRKEQECRRLRVGTPPDFQGDERGVMFLSMVIAPGTRTTSLTKLEYQRRFNVAASRAEDQVWLFHSVTADSLNPADLRHSYLTYLLTRPQGEVDDGLGDVQRDILRPPFDSLFEQRVFLDIRARGYQVTPQVEVNGRRIDLVVTGGSAKLAVECDGDAWHSTPEQVEADLARERELKRAGWRFWRVRESEYNFDPQQAMADLWRTLDARAIQPFTTFDSESTGSEDGNPPASRWTPMALSDEEGLDDVEEELATAS